MIVVNNSKEFCNTVKPGDVVEYVVDDKYHTCILVCEFHDGENTYKLVDVNNFTVFDHVSNLRSLNFYEKIRILPSILTIG